MKYFNHGPLLAAFRRDIGQFVSLVGMGRKILMPADEQLIRKAGIMVKVVGQGVRIFFDDVEITKGPGLNIAINTLGIWTDSSCARWKVLERNKDSLKIKMEFNNLPLCQVWGLRIEDNASITWSVSSEIEEGLCINEIRVICFAGAKIGLKPKGNRRVIFNIYGDKFAGIKACHDNPGNVFDLPFVGFNKQWTDDGVNHPAGNYNFFTGIISLEECVDSPKVIVGTRVKPLDGGLVSSKAKRRLRVLLVNIPWQENGKWGVRAGSRWPHLKDSSEESYLPFPFFLAYAAALLEKNDVQVHMIDAIADKMSEEAFFDSVFNARPDYLVAETSVPSFNHDMNLLEKIAKRGVSVILCGPCAQIYERSFLEQNKCIDFVLYGEYEYILLDLILSLRDNKRLSKIKGLIYKENAIAVKNLPRSPIDINLLPWPHRKTLPMARYIDNPGNIPYPCAQMLASRGCLFGCNFCLWPQVMYQGTTYRTRSVKDVIDEMEFLVKPGMFKSVYFDDDTFNIGKERMLAFSKEIITRDLQAVPWAIMARADLMDEEILFNMKEAGLFAVKYGVESASQELIDACGKGMDLKRAEKMILFTKELGIRTHLTFTFGLSGETKSTIERTIDYALKLNPYSVQFSITTPFPGTRYFHHLDKSGRIMSKSRDQYGGNPGSVIKYDYLDSDELELARQRAYSLWEKNKAMASKI